MTLSKIQSSNTTKAFTVDTTISLTLTGVASGNNLAVVALTSYGGSGGVFAISDDKGNSYSSQASSTGLNQTGLATIAVASNVAAGDTIITATRVSTSGADMLLAVVEYNVSDGIALYEDSSFSVGFSAAGDSGGAIASDTAILLGGTINETVAPTIDGSWTTVGTYTNNYVLNVIEQISVVANTYNLTSSWTGSYGWTNMLAVIQSDGSGGGGGGVIQFAAAQSARCTPIIF